MRHVLLITAVAAAAMAVTGCSGSDEGSGGGNGTGGTAGTGGTGGDGPDVALSFDETTSIPATAASAAAMEAATRFANTVSTIVDLATAGADAAVQGVSPKVLVPGFCASGQADLVLPPGLPSNWSPGDQIVLTLTDCQGSALSSGAVSGTVTIDIEEVTSSLAGVLLDVTVDLGPAGLTGDATINGTFAGQVAVFGLGDVGLQIGKKLDDDDLTISDGALSLALGCFEILVPPNSTIAPLAVAKLGNQVFTINDYAQNPPSITLEDGVPSGGTLAMHSGDNSAVSVDRTGPCPGFELPGDGSTITATFSEGGCIELSGAVQQSTSWAKLSAGDLSPGGGPECNFDVTCEAVEGALELVDSEFLDGDWDIPIVSQTDGSSIEQEAARQASGGTDGGPFRQMTHAIQPATGCQNMSCSLVVYHQSSLTYDPSQEGAIAFIDYSEAQRMIEAAFPGAAVGWAFYVEQGGTPYIALGEETALTRAGWRTNSICGITPDDFTAEGLDFSASGGPITFGYTRSNTNTSAANVQRNVHGIDEFKVVIVKEPT